MPRDFTITIYRTLLESIKDAGYTFRTFYDYMCEPENTKKIVILRHDIDANPGKALEFAVLENELGIRSTFYFKTTQGVYNEKIIRKVADLGHEIGYHYQDLSAAKGDKNAAIGLFSSNLTMLRRICSIQTICMDGSIRSKWNNLDLWIDRDYHAFDLKGEPYLDIDFNKVLYLTDTGRGWNAVKYSLYDKVKTRFDYYHKSTPEIMTDLKTGSLPDQIMITSHPQRWHENMLSWMKELVMQNLKNQVKFWIISRR